MIDPSPYMSMWPTYEKEMYWQSYCAECDAYAQAANQSHFLECALEPNPFFTIKIPDPCLFAIS